MTTMRRPLDPLLTRLQMHAARLHQMEWLRRQIDAALPSAAGPVAGAINALAGSPTGVDVTAHPWTGSWLRTAIRMTHRRAPVLLPEGHLVGHLSTAHNLSAAVAVLDGAHTVDVRLDARGTATLPGTGHLVVVGWEAAGSVRSVRVGASMPGWVSMVSVAGVEVSATEGDRRDALHQAVQEATILLGPELERVRQSRTILVVDGYAAADARDLTIPALDGSLLSGAGMAELIEAALHAASTAEHTAVRVPELVPVTRGPLAEALAAAGVPAAGGINRISDRELRRDVSFDHLSLLSVNDPVAFDRIARCAASGTDTSAARVAGHCAYIRRDFQEAARRYGDCLRTAPEDMDLWRDLCWALRHDGREDLATTWVLHPAEVVKAAARTRWAPMTHTRSAAADDPSAGLRAAVRLLEGMTTDLRAG